jgi:hypothetical protein
MTIRDEFLAKTKMIDANGHKKGVEDVTEYLFKDEVIYRMIIASDLEMPVLTLIAKDLEKKFDENSDFPLVVMDDNKNAVYRQNVGRIIKFIMLEYGYTPVDGGLSERARIPAVSGANYFSTSAIYAKTTTSNKIIKVTSEEV